MTEATTEEWSTVWMDTSFTPGSTVTARLLADGQEACTLRACGWITQRSVAVGPDGKARELVGAPSRIVPGFLGSTGAVQALDRWQVNVRGYESASWEVRVAGDAAPITINVPPAEVEVVVQPSEVHVEVVEPRRSRVIRDKRTGEITAVEAE